MMERNEENSSNNIQFSVDEYAENKSEEQKIEMQNLNEDQEKELQKKKSKIKRNKNIKWIIYAVSMLVMTGVIFHSIKLYGLISSYTFLPEHYIKYLGYGLIGVNLFFCIFAFLPNVNNLNKILQSILCVILAYALAMANVIIPDYEGQMKRMFIEVPTEGDLMINVYVLKESEVTDIYGLQGKLIGIQSQFDVEYQDYALKVINREFEGDPVVSKSYDDIYSIVEALYAGEVDAILLNESYVEIISENNDFLTYEEDTRVVYSCVQKISLEYDSANIENITTEPFIILIGGSDSRNYNNLFATRSAGRTDVNMLAIFNPVTKQALIITIPRDAYVPLWGNTNCMDKLTHATVYSISAWQQTINTLFDIKINYFFRVNFLSIIKIIDALGGLEIDNPYAFDTESCLDPDTLKTVYHYFPEGKITLTGGQTLGYTRERKGYKPDGTQIGDFGRNQHQAIVVDALIKKVTSVSTITNIPELLKAVEGTFFTDITIDSIYALAQMQLNDMATWDVVQHNLTGRGASRTSYAMGQSSGKTYSVVILNDGPLNKAKAMIQQILNNEIVQKD
ncbi:MAG: LCP family protein [Bacillota bacterium]|nr:LCP family protein [Bacillota bacterium]NLL27080.1 LCP family protein [Erysipelotrichia bacterium]